MRDCSKTAEGECRDSEPTRRRQYSCISMTIQEKRQRYAPCAAAFLRVTRTIVLYTSDFSTFTGSLPL
jgi:hypothetical protein